MSGTFSKKQGLGSFKGAPVNDDAPTKLRIGVWNLIEDLVEKRIPYVCLPYYEGLHNEITRIMNLERNNSLGSTPQLKDLVINILDWNELFDLIQYLFRIVLYYERDDSFEGYTIVAPKSPDARYNFTKLINELFASNNMGWRLEKGAFKRVQNDVLDAALISQAKVLLSSPEFAGPNNQFNKALGFLNKRPVADKENCVKEAVGALEGLARILLRDKDITLGKATDIFVARSIIRKPFDRTFHALYGFVSNEPGSRHGAYALSSLDTAETEYVLYSGAACMLFLANRCGIEPPKIKARSEIRASSEVEEMEFPEESDGKPHQDNGIPF